MLCKDLAHFQKELKDPFKIYLILAKEESDRKRALALILKQKEISSSFNPPTFNLQIFLQEIDTLPFLTKQKVILLENIDELEKETLKEVCTYCEKPNPWISLVLTASHLPSQNKILKACEKEGLVFLQEEEKPWEKEKRLEKWVIEEMKKGGVEIDSAAALRLVQSTDLAFLQNEIEKLICYAGEKRKITLQDVQSLCPLQPQETLWRLSDAIFQKNRQNALQICEHLIENESDVFLALGSLRSQIQTAYQALFLFQEEGKGAVTKAFPYLKGQFLDKKLQLFQEYGSVRLKRALFLIFETEIDLKNLSQDPKILFQILLIKLTNDSLSFTKRIRPCF